MPSITRKRKKEILQFLEKLPVEVKSLPTLDELISNHLSIKDIQDIQIEDLLGRDSVPPRLELLHSCIADKNVMITGAGGSIGSELCRQVAANKPRSLILYERSEFALYTIESEMRSQFKDSLEIIPILGSVTHKRRILAVIKALSVETIYHAAAYKHVPLVEYNPIEGVRNNVFGTLKTAEAAVEGGVETFVLISTDKAVRPANVMGASKRMAELVLQALADKGEKTRFTMVRFGNVLGSSGSVVPHFRKQIKEGGPVTVTHKDVIRFFMTIPEAVQLVIQAGAMGTGGDVFVLDMGEPVRIMDLAKNLIRLCGCTVRDSVNPNGDIPIEFSGLRPGEKLYEELLVGENVVGTTHPMIMRAEERMIPWKLLAPAINGLDRACRNFEYEKVRSTLLEIVDGYSPQCAIIDPIWKSMEEKIGKEARKKSMKLLFKKM
jgi:FlaA1/EpsC-like NDP-sugar epimerase